MAMSLKHPTLKSFSFAFDGIKEALKNEPNFRIHSIFAIAVLLLAIFLKVSLVEFAIIFLTIGFVLLFELINTSLEALVDLVSPEIKPRAKVAKDVAASAVLVSALTSIAVGMAIFLPKILQYFD